MVKGPKRNFFHFVEHEAQSIWGQRKSREGAWLEDISVLAGGHLRVCRLSENLLEVPAENVLEII